MYAIVKIIHYRYYNPLLKIEEENKSVIYILVWLDNRHHNRKPNAADPYWYRLFRTNFPD